MVFFFFFIWTIFKVIIEFVTILFLFCFVLFCPKAGGILTLRPGIELTHRLLETKVLTTGYHQGSPSSLIMIPHHDLLEIFLRRIIIITSC